MLAQQTLRRLKLTGMADALEQQLAQPQVHALLFEERVGLLVDHELTTRDNRRLERLLRTAKLKHPACVEDINYRHPRGLQRPQLASLITADWVRIPAQAGPAFRLMSGHHSGACRASGGRDN